MNAVFLVFAHFIRIVFCCCFGFGCFGFDCFFFGFGFGFGFGLC